jgi:hypothetical protein
VTVPPVVLVPLPLRVVSVVVPAPVPWPEPVCASTVETVSGKPATRANIVYFIDRLMFPPVNAHVRRVWA